MPPLITAELDRAIDIIIQTNIADVRQSDPGLFHRAQVIDHTFRGNVIGDPVPVAGYTHRAGWILKIADRTGFILSTYFSLAHRGRNQCQNRESEEYAFDFFLFHKYFYNQ